MGLTHTMLGAAGRAASGLVKQSFVSSNVAKLLPASQQRQFSVSQPVDNHKGKVVSVIGAVVDVPADDLTDPAPATTFAHLDATTVLSRSVAERGIYPAVDPL